MIKVLNATNLYSSLYSLVDFCKNNEQEKIEIVVPDKLSLFMEKFLFEKLNITASFNIKVSTLNRFAKRNLDVNKDKQISKIGSILLINKILNDNVDKFSIFNSKTYSFSYAENILRTINQFKASKITFEELLKFNSKDEQLAKKISDLAIVYNEYEQAKAGLLDASDMFLLSAFSVANGKENSKIVLVGFDDFTAIEYSIIEQLAKTTTVYVYNYFSKAKNNYIYNNELINQLKNIAYINELPIEIEETKNYANEFKQFLDFNIFSTQRENFCLTNQNLKIYSGKSIEDELEFVARSMRSKILNGENYSDFGVAVFGLENYTNQIKDIFSKYEINYYIDEEISINKSVVYKFFNSVFRYNLDGYGLSHLIDIINSPFFEFEESLKQSLISELIKVGFSGKVKSNFALLDENLEMQEKFIKFMQLIDFDKNLSVEKIVEKLNYICDCLKIDDKILELTNQTNDVENKILQPKSKQVIFEFLLDIIKFYPTADFVTFYDIYSHIPSVLKINNLPLHLDCVKVVDANSNMEIFNNLFIVNIRQENAPNLKYDCGIILDGEIEKLNFSNKLSPTISHINKLSKLRLYNLFSMFENDLTITYSKNSAEIVKELLNKIQVKIDDEIINLLPLVQGDFNQNIALSKWDYITKISKNIEKFSKINEKITKNKEFLQISNENLKIYENLKTVSASLLENYFKCPFYMFLTNILKIKPRLDNEIMSFDIGNVLHEILFKYYKKNKQVGDVYEFCKTEVFSFIEKDDRLKFNLNSPVLINLIDEAVRVINGSNFIDENCTFVPTKFEYEFGGETSLKLKNIDIIGKIDRVDIFNDLIRIVDYKSGKADSNLKELYYGNKLQLFLYSCAIEEELNKKVVGSFYLPLHNKYSTDVKNNYSLNGFFVNEDFVIKALDKNIQAGEKSNIVDMSLTNNFVAKNMPKSNEMDNLKEYAKLVTENAVDEIKTGFIKPTPIDSAEICQYCPYSQTCLKQCKNIQFRHAKSVNFSSFKEVDNA